MYGPRIHARRCDLTVAALPHRANPRAAPFPVYAKPFGNEGFRAFRESPLSLFGKFLGGRWFREPRLRTMILADIPAFNGRCKTENAAFQLAHFLRLHSASRSNKITSSHSDQWPNHPNNCPSIIRHVTPNQRFSELTTTGRTP